MLRFLSPENMDEVLGLQKDVHEYLKLYSNPRFIVPRTKDYFREHLEKPHTIMGFQENGKHVAQAIFHAPEDFDVAELGIQCLPGHSKGERASVLQGMIVHPEFRGRGMMHQFIASWISWCHAQGIKHLAARTEHSHETSKRNFIAQDFKMIETMIDPRDGAKICVFHRSFR